MNVYEYNDGYTVAMGVDSEPFAVIEWTHKITGHQFKKICFEHKDVMDYLELHMTPGHYYHDYLPNIHYSDAALQLYGIGGDVYAAT